MDLLQEAFEAYKRLLDIEYSYVVLDPGCMAAKAEQKFGTKVRSELKQEIFFRFRKSDFYHFTGFQHAQNANLTAYDRNQKMISSFFDDVASHKIKYEEVENIEDRTNREYLDQRLKLIAELERNLDGNNILRDYDGYLYKSDDDKGTEKLKSADCLIQTRNESLNKIFYFFSLNEIKLFPPKKPQLQSYCCYPCSINFNENEDYSKYHKLITVLIKKKSVSAGSEDTLFISERYLLSNPENIEKEKDYLRNNPDYVAGLLGRNGVAEEFKERLRNAVK